MMERRPCDFFKRLESRLSVRSECSVSRLPFRLRQHWRGATLPSILTVPGCSTTTVDHPFSPGCMQPLEAVKYRDHRTRTTYLPGSGTDTVSERGSRAITCPGGEMTGCGSVTA